MATKFQDLSDADLVHGVLGNERELVGLRFKHSMNQLENTARLGVLRRDIARMRTELRTRERAQGLGNDALMARHRGSFVAGGAEQGAAAKGGFLSGVVDKLTASE